MESAEIGYNIEENKHTMEAKMIDDGCVGLGEISLQAMINLNATRKMRIDGQLTGKQFHAQAQNKSVSNHNDMSK